MTGPKPAVKRSILFLSVLVMIVQSGCSYLALSRRTKFVCPTENVKISIAEKVDGEYEEITNRKTSIKLNHFKKGYWVKQEREGYVSNTYELSRTSVNALNRLDKTLLIVTDAFVTIFLPLHYLVGRNSDYGQNGNIRQVQTVMLFTALGIGVAGWGAVIPAPKKLYPKTVELPSLIRIVTKDTNQLSIVAGKHEFKLSKSGIAVRDFPTMVQFNKGYGYESRDTIDNFKFLEEAKLYDDVAKLLREAEYGIDSTEATLDNTLRAKSWTRSIVFMTADDKLRCDVRTTWALETLDELQYLYDRTMNGNSEWVDFKEDSLDEVTQLNTTKKAMLEALGGSFKKFLALDTVQSILSAPVPIPLREHEELELYTGSTFATSVTDAVKAVITVVTDEGHGSGCIVTPDGYIITNAHVVEDDTVNIKAILSNKLDKKYPLKFIRMNKAVDLALLKLDTANMTPFELADLEDIEVGADVYAIGTPADVDLGQTVTRGIISGKRKFGGHQMIQTDVAISPGNSGGALIRSNGVLCGIVTSQLRERQVNDIGFAIPASLIEESLKIKLNQ
ncbi:MAG: trypsin-like peptidase domain-containing protein [Flavobacteriales bacterium]|nr:trypsin-like peptidase domain-containing protein [Flavobacteriales bacterium]